MKNKKLLFILLSILILSSSFALSTTYAKRCQPKTTYKDLQITTTGTAYDSKTHQTVEVTITLQGTAKTHGNTWQLKIKGGTITVEGHEIIFAYRGTGIIIPKHHFMILNLCTKSQYGDIRAVWTLKGRAYETSDNEYSIRLYDHKVYLPERHYPKLYNLKQFGNLILS